MVNDRDLLDEVRSDGFLNEMMTYDYVSDEHFTNELKIDD
jgi:hypothetical protein